MLILSLSINLILWLFKFKIFDNIFLCFRFVKKHFKKNYIYTTQYNTIKYINPFTHTYVKYLELTLTLQLIGKA